MAEDPMRAHFERRDAQLGVLLVEWARHSGVTVDGPLEAPGMDPRWIAHFRSVYFEAELMVFYGPMVDVSAFRPQNVDLGYLVGGEQGVSDERFIDMLNDLAACAGGDPEPQWLRFVPS